MNSLEKLGFNILSTKTQYGKVEYVYMKDENILVDIKSVVDDEPLVQIIFAGRIIDNNELIDINNAIKDFWDENKEKFKVGE